MESGDRIRALIAEMRGEIRNLVAWLDISQKMVPHLYTDVGLPIPYGASEHRSADASSGQRGWPLSFRPCINHISKKIVELGIYMNLVEIAWNGSLPERWSQTVSQSR